MKTTSWTVLASLCVILFANVSLAKIPGYQARTDRKYPQVVDFLKALKSKYPARVSRFVLGKSDSGVNIEGVRIGTGATRGMIVATHHGNEYGSSEVALAAAADLADRPVSGLTVYVVPVLNVGGYNSRSREETASGVSHDPNRDYPGPCGSDSEFALRSTKALAEFVGRESIVSVATLHTYYPTVVYPWGFGTRDLETEHQAEFVKLVEAATSESKYETGNSTTVMYPANGTFEDYAFWKHGIWSLLFELGFSHSPQLAEIDEMVRVNLPGLRALLETAPKTRAARHAFTGQCDSSLRILDRRDE
jgi:predicted deacylase